jgi:hypothetical protein
LRFRRDRRSSRTPTLRQIELSSQEHEAARATAERQLARVREQMALYATPMVASYVRRPFSIP